MSKASFLKEKTDAQCRELAAHYYARARKAEKELQEARSEILRMRTSMQGFRSLAYDLIEQIEA